MPLNSEKLRSKLGEFSIFTLGCLVLIFTTRGVVEPPANNLIMSATSIQSFRHLECQNPSIISESIGIPNRSEKMGGKSEESQNTEHGGTESYSYRRGLLKIHYSFREGFKNQ